jgi:hypothetical protein
MAQPAGDRHLVVAGEVSMNVPPALRRVWREIKFWGYGQGWLNRRSRRELQRQPPTLTPSQQKVVADLNHHGLAVVGIEELPGLGDIWPRAAEAGREFVASERVQRGIDAYRPEEGKAQGKDYLVRQWESRPTLDLTDLWLRLGLSQAILDPVNVYLGLWSKLNYVDLWYTIPSAAERKAVASQRWHRDPEDERLVKVFLYLSDIDAEAGPLEYVRGSHGGGRHGALWPNPDPGTASYPPDGAVEATIPAGDRVACTGPTGTLVFCDTHGLHRGGLAREKPRVLANWAYVTPASIFARRFEVARSPHNGDLSQAARFALE